MYASDYADSNPSVYGVAVPATYYSDVDLRRQHLPRENRLQPAQLPPIVFQPPLEDQARRQTKEYFTLKDSSVQREYRRLSSSNVRQQEIRRSDQASQYSDSDVQTATRPQPSNKAQSKVL